MQAFASGNTVRMMFLVLAAALLFAPRMAAAQDDPSLSPSLSGPFGDSLSDNTPTSGLSSEVVAGASSLAPTDRKTGISDPTGDQLENSVRNPDVSGAANSDPAQDFRADVDVDAARASMIEVYSGSRAAFQPAFAGTLAASFRGNARANAQRPAGASLASAAPGIGTTPGIGAAFGRGSQLLAFGSSGAGTPMDTDAYGNPLIYVDPSLIQNSTLVTEVGSIPGQSTSSLPGTPLPSFAADNYAGPGAFPDSTRGTAGSPPEFTIPSEVLLSQRGLKDSPFPSISQTDTFLRPTLLLSTALPSRRTAAQSTSLTPRERRARMLATLSGAPLQMRGGGTPAFEQKRTDKLRGMRQHPGERPSRVTLTPTNPQP